MYRWSVGWYMTPDMRVLGGTSGDVSCYKWCYITARWCYMTCTCPICGHLGIPCTTRYPPLDTPKYHIYWYIRGFTLFYRWFWPCIYRYVQGGIWVVQGYVWICIRWYMYVYRHTQVVYVPYIGCIVVLYVCYIPPQTPCSTLLCTGGGVVYVHVWYRLYMAYFAYKTPYIPYIRYMGWYRRVG